MNCCFAAAIYGIDGTPWATSADWAGLNEYDHALEQDDGSFKDVKVNEFHIALKAAEGQRAPSAAGIRMINTKFMFIRNEDNVTYLSRTGGGGACVAKTKNALIIGVWDKNAKMSNNQN